MLPDVVESVEERVAKILWLFKETIVCDVLAGVIPDAFGRIQFRPVGRKLEHFHVAAVGLSTLVGFLPFLVRGAVFYPVSTGAVPVEGKHLPLFPEWPYGFPFTIDLAHA